MMYEEADDKLLSMAQELIKQHHPHLLHAKIGFMYRDQAPESRGRKTLGAARKVGSEWDPFVDLDFVIWIAKKEFERMRVDKQRALVDHELCHCGGTWGNWQMNPHDLNEFLAVIYRHGFWHGDLENLDRAIKARAAQQPGLFTGAESMELGSVVSVPVAALAKDDSEPAFDVKGLLARARKDPDAVAAEVVRAAEAFEAEHGKLSASKLQRVYGVGYSTANSLMDLINSVRGEN
jgi:hypothetical protein